MLFLSWETALTVKGVQQSWLVFMGTMSFLLEAPELDTVLQMGTHKSRAEE